MISKSRIQSSIGATDTAYQTRLLVVVDLAARVSADSDWFRFASCMCGVRAACRLAISPYWPYDIGLNFICRVGRISPVVERKRLKSCGQKKKCQFLILHDVKRKSEIIHRKIFWGKKDIATFKKRKNAIITKISQRNSYEQEWSTCKEKCKKSLLSGPISSIFMHINVCNDIFNANMCS